MCGLTDIVPSIAAVAAVAIYFWQARIAAHASKGQSIVALITMLQSEPVRVARGRVRIGKTPEQVKKWNTEAREDATLLCNAYDLAAILIKEGIVQEAIVVENWGPSIVDCYERVAALIAEVRAGTSGPDHWKNFEWLYKQAIKAGSAKLVSRDAEANG